MFYPEYTNFTKVNAGYMPWSLNRLAATFNAAEPPERFGLLFPLYNYHDRWTELESDDFKRYEPDANRGYTYLDTAAAVNGVERRAVVFDAAAYDKNIAYLKKLARLCETKGSELIFFIAPSLGPWEEAYMDALARDVGELAAFYDFNDHYDKLNIDITADYYDYLHFNHNGAVKFTEYLSKTFFNTPR